MNAEETYEELASPPGTTGFRITIDGLIGGHSGIEIDKGRGSAHQLMARLLVNAPAELERLADLIGGDTLNAIPSKATAVVAVPASQAEAFGKYVDEFGATVKSELAATDPGVVVTASPVDLPPKVMEAAAQGALIGAVYAVPQGVYRMSADVPGLVETSGNLGVLTIADGRFTAGAKVRSALDSERDAEAQRYVDVFEQAGATVELEGAYSSWPPDPDSPLLALMEQVFTDLFGTAPIVTAIHAGLETSVAGETYPELDMISVGPTTQNVHTPDERLEVASVPKVYDLLVATLRQVE